MKQEVLKHLLVLGVYLAVITGVKLLASGLGRIDVSLLWLWVGGLTGYVLVFLDRLVYVYWLHPQEQLSQQVKYYLQKRNLFGALELIHRRRGEQTKLAFRSFLFVVAWVPLTIFALTSTGEVFSQALVMGLGLHLVYDFWRDQQNNPIELNRKLFWQIKRSVERKEQELFLYIFSGVFVVLTWMLV